METPHYAIVIDTSVARAASPNQSDESDVAIKCWKTLETFKDAGYRLAMSEPLQQEWLKQETERPAGSWEYYTSRYAMIWLTAMEASAQVAWLTLPPESVLRASVMTVARQIYPPESHAPNQIAKDILLVETAVAADHRIISLNDRERRRFQRISPQVPDLRTVFWTDPQREDVPAWLRAGAPEQDALRLADKGQARVI